MWKTFPSRGAEILAVQLGESYLRFRFYVFDKAQVVFLASGVIGLTSHPRVSNRLFLRKSRCEFRFVLEPPFKIRCRMNGSILQIMKELLQSAQICEVNLGRKKLARILTWKVRIFEGQRSLHSQGTGVLILKLTWSFLLLARVRERSLGRVIR